MIAAVLKADGNEAETRRRVERIFESVMGYDAFTHISREHAVRGAGETEHCDFAIQLEEGDAARPIIMVELKRVGVDLAPKHLKQVSSYAINAGCEWILLTNGREWRLHHVVFGQPPETKMLRGWNLLQDEPASLVQSFGLISYANVKKGRLDTLWEKTNVLTPRNVLSALLSEECIKVLRRGLRKTTEVSVSPEEVVGALRRLLNEAAISELSDIRISLPDRKRRRTRRPRKQNSDDEAGASGDGAAITGEGPAESEEDVAGARPDSSEDGRPTPPPAQ